MDISDAGTGTGTGKKNLKTSLNWMNLPAYNKRKASVLNGFGCIEQWKKKSGSSSNKYVSATKPLKTVWFIN